MMAESRTTPRPRSRAADHQKTVIVGLAIGGVLAWTTSIGRSINSLYLNNDMFATTSRSLSVETLSTVKPIPQTEGFPCDIVPQDDMFRSASEEDRDLYNVFSRLCGGSYIEVGALDGKMFSNTNAFNEGMGWEGVLIEANEKHFASLQTNRPHELAVVHAAVCREDREMRWVSTDNRNKSGFVEFSTSTFRKQFWDQELLINTKRRRCERLETILRRTVLDKTYFDFMTLDVAGAELSALNSIDLDEYEFGYILVSADGSNGAKDLSVRLLLEERGYKFMGIRNGSARFVHPNFHKIYRNFVN